jgi:hypothetical protein
MIFLIFKLALRLNLNVIVKFPTVNDVFYTNEGRTKQKSPEYAWHNYCLLRNKIYLTDLLNSVWRSK